MQTVQRQNLLQDVNQFRRVYEEASSWKRSFAGGSFNKQFKILLERNQADEEILLRCFASTGQVGWKNEQRKETTFLEKFVDKGLVRLFTFLCCVLDDEQHTDDFFSPIHSIFDTLSDRNRVSCEPKWDNKPLWSHPGIPCLLESLIQLLSAEKTKYKVFNNRWTVSGYCWQTAGSHAQQLADIAFSDLSNTPLYADMPIGKVASAIKDRAQVVCDMSDDEAKKSANYQEVDGNPTGGFKPMPGRCQVFFAAVKKQVNFVGDLKVLMNETGGLHIFRRYLGLTLTRQ